MRPSGLLGTLTLLLGLVACDSPLSTSEFRLLALAEQRWAAREFANYSIETRSSCFCAPEVNGWVRIEVADGQVRKATLLDTGEVITDTRLSFWETVEALFVSIRNTGDSNYLSDVEVAFDPILGFPAFVNWKVDENILDGGGTRTLRNAQPLP